MNRIFIFTSLALSSFGIVGIANSMEDNNNRGVVLPGGGIYCPSRNETVQSKDNLGPRQYRNRFSNESRECGRGYAHGPRDGRGNGPRDGRGHGNGPQDSRGNGPRDGSGPGCRY